MMSVERLVRSFLCRPGFLQKTGLKPPVRYQIIVENGTLRWSASFLTFIGYIIPGDISFAPNPITQSYSPGTIGIPVA